jgi:hypothetical protein
VEEKRQRKGQNLAIFWRDFAHVRKLLVRALPGGFPNGRRPFLGEDLFVAAIIGNVTLASAVAVPGAR